MAFKTLALQSEVKGPDTLSESEHLRNAESHALLQIAQWDLDLTSISGDQMHRAAWRFQRQGGRRETGKDQKHWTTLS